MSYNIFVAAVLCLQFLLASSLYEEYKKPTYLESRVGGYVIFDCEFFLFLSVKSCVKTQMGSIYRSIGISKRLPNNLPSTLEKRCEYHFECSIQHFLRLMYNV